jgi:hypothetical protein
LPVTVISTNALAAAVAADPAMPSGIRIRPVPELSNAVASCDSIELLSWMGWMSAGPPTLAAEALRSAGLWAWVRYRWALEDQGGRVRPTADARLVHRHSRSLFSETVGVGAAGYLACDRIFPAGTLGVANLDDAIDPLLESRVIGRVGASRRQPDYLIARDLVSGPLELLALECKGTVKSEPMAIGQLAAGVHQVIGIESGLPMRRVVVATSLQLDDKRPSVRCHAIEVVTGGGPAGNLSLQASREAFRDVVLMRALRCAGLYDVAERVRMGYFPDSLEAPESFSIADRPMVGHAAEIALGESRLRAEVGFDLDFLQALAAPGPERSARLEAVARTVIPDRDRPRRTRTPEHVQEETLMRDGVGILFEQQGQAPAESNFL